MTTRFEVTMSDGWKTRVNADSAEAAKSKAEKLSRHGDKAISATECDDVRYDETSGTVR